LFDAVSDKFNAIFSKVRGRAQLSEQNISDALKDIRMTLLEADVNFKVVKSFTVSVRDKALGTEVTARVTPGQQFIKIVHDELVDLLGATGQGLALSGPSPAVIMLVGLVGSGKTTTAGKLALHLSKKNRTALMIAADTRRPAARRQLLSIGERTGIEVFSDDQESSPSRICAGGVSHAARKGIDTVIIDTAGRQAVDAELMQELAELKRAIAPREVLLVADSMSGQDAVTVAAKFHEALGLTGVILTKLDGDTRGGAALSIKAVAGTPIKFAGTGEKLEDLVAFDPQRMATRILGMGDIVGLVEKAQSAVDEKKAQELEKKIKKGGFTLDDFLDQIRSVKKMGSIESILGMVPGMKGLSSKVDYREAESELKKIEAIINSMTVKERGNHTIINGSRRKRIAAGSGTRVEDVNKLLKKYGAAKKMLKKLSKGGLKQFGRGMPPFPM
jgi:signal recognition particle subunit SRP54